MGMTYKWIGTVSTRHNDELFTPTTSHLNLFLICLNESFSLETFIIGISKSSLKNFANLTYDI